MSSGGAELARGGRVVALGQREQAEHGAGAHLAQRLALRTRLVEPPPSGGVRLLGPPEPGVDERQRYSSSRSPTVRWVR